MDQFSKYVKRPQPYLVAVDFDGTIVEWVPGQIGPEIEGAIDWLKLFRNKYGARLMLWTTRSHVQPNGDKLREAVEFCRARGLTFDLVNRNPNQQSKSPKVFANVYIDDLAFGCPSKRSDRSKYPFVDWSIVGPEVAIRIAQWNSRNRTS